jgi:hypothetical protein
LPKAKVFLRQQRSYIRERQAAVEAAQKEWLDSMIRVEVETDPLLRHSQQALLRQVQQQTSLQCKITRGRFFSRKNIPASNVVRLDERSPKQVLKIFFGKFRG